MNVGRLSHTRGKDNDGCVFLFKTANHITDY